MSIPINDWQFWATTAVFVLALGWLLRGVLPIPFLSERHKRKKRQTRVSLTVGGKVAK
jgi:hypothetical protein